MASTSVESPTKASTVDPELQEPPRYQVVLLNDDFTPMDFVVQLLQFFFSMSEDQATEIMLEVHHHGRGTCGIFSWEVAETKANQVLDFAKTHDHPLACVVEPV